MNAEWIPPQGYIEMTGVVLYRCGACGTIIEGGHVLADQDGPLDGRGITPDTRAYHPEHVPDMED